MTGIRFERRDVGNGEAMRTVRALLADACKAGRYLHLAMVLAARAAASRYIRCCVSCKGGQDQQPAEREDKQDGNTTPHQSLSLARKPRIGEARVM